MIKKILIPIDGSDQSYKAVDFGADIADKYGAEVHLLHVVPVEEVPEAIRRFAKAEHLPGPPAFTQHRYVAERILEEGKRRALEHGNDNVQAIVADGDPAGTILRYLKENGFDLVVVGTRGLSDFKGLIMGSVSHKVVQLAVCPCVSVH